MIEVKHLTKVYGEARGIEDINFTMERGEIMGFLGPNGAGKTTTMRILTCFMPATSGTAKVAGYDVFEDSLNVRRRIGYLPETVPLYTDMQVPAYLKYVAGLKDVPWKKIKSRVGRVMEQVGLSHMAHKYIGELSKGYRQRVGLGQALINDPEVLILDEPTIGLDPQQIIEIRSLIKGLSGDRTIILSSHVLPEVSMLCGRVIIIDEGKLKAIDTPENLVAKLQASDSVKARISGPADSVISALKGIEGVKKVESSGAVGSSGEYVVEFVRGFNGSHLLARVAVERKWDLYELTPIKMSLEDIFIHIVTDEDSSL
ncbi:MAG TPA: ATP-binding cassette domain-containing protein [Nitrospirae bacterium]|nr:ATP-binding cassette domain-containing protein [Nitrospirota bacterium]